MMFGTLMDDLSVFAVLVLLIGFPLNQKALVHAQDQADMSFISIDCGLQDKNSSYIESTTGIKYSSDASFIDTGEIKLVYPEYRDTNLQPYETLRIFPEGIRNCYNINVTSRTKYLIRTCFLYGNYDGLDKSPEFELHFGANLWDLMSFNDAATDVNKELVHFVPDGVADVQVCLVNIGSGVPFISSIELRPLNNESYDADFRSLALEWRYDTGLTANKIYRYPEDVHDRFWYFYESLDDWDQLNTSSTIDPLNQNSFDVPSIVMSTAVKPKNVNDSMNISWQPTDQSAGYFLYMHFAEVEKLQPNQSRWLYITKNGQIYNPPFEVAYMWPSTSYRSIAMTGSQTVSIFKVENSTLPSILNAFELYKVKTFTEQVTSQGDVAAIRKVKSSYKIRRNWQGDPCAPQVYSWQGLNCTYLKSDQALRIISLNLSSSGLTGEIQRSLSDLTILQTLDMSNNNLTGPVPEFLSQLSNLKFLNLENNNLQGRIPDGLIERINDGSLTLSLCQNPNVSGIVSCTKIEKKKQNFSIPIGLSVAGVSIFLLTISAIFWGLRRKRKHDKTSDAKSQTELGSLESTKRQFTHSEILKFTNNLESTIGKGGFGTVYHGYIDETQVAVKMLSPSSVQGLQEFHAEVSILMRVHHTNLTSLVGYCNDEKNIGLVYEYMANGNLQEHLSDRSSTILGWEDRLRIAVDAAQGLEYLHCGCKPPIVHRDVKTANILLTENFQAKVADFGLSRNFPTDFVTHITTGIAGTPGYLDPEYYLTSRLNEKSDVYSFGIVLLEIITSRPVISGRVERVHISQWVSTMLAEQGDICTVVDSRLERSFNPNCVWKVLELAMACIMPDPIKRPMMSQVVMELKECLATTLAGNKAQKK